MDIIKNITRDIIEDNFMLIDIKDSVFNMEDSLSTIIYTFYENKYKNKIKIYSKNIKTSKISFILIKKTNKLNIPIIKTKKIIYSEIILKEKSILILTFQSDNLKKDIKEYITTKILIEEENSKMYV